jgi:hypothetical protein
MTDHTKLLKECVLVVKEDTVNCEGDGGTGFEEQYGPYFITYFLISISFNPRDQSFKWNR